MDAFKGSHPPDFCIFGRQNRNEPTFFRKLFCNKLAVSKVHRHNEKLFLLRAINTFERSLFL